MTKLKAHACGHNPSGIKQKSILLVVLAVMGKQPPHLCTCTPRGSEGQRGLQFSLSNLEPYFSLFFCILECHLTAVGLSAIMLISMRLMASGGSFGCAVSASSELLFLWFAATLANVRISSTIFSAWLPLVNCTQASSIRRSCLK